MVVVEALMVSALVSTLTANAGTLLNRELGLAWDAKLELRKLVSTLSTIETMLQASEEMPSHNREMQQWLRKLQDAVDEATILLDSFFLKKGQLFPLSSKFPYINGPPKMRKMKSLRHLDVDECESLDHMPNRIGQLQFLQTLGNVENGSEAGDANLKEKEHLNTLSLSWKAGNCRNLPGSDKVFDALQPHKYLKRLSVQEYKGKSFASWLNSYCLPNLVELTLINCRGCESLPPLGELPSLKSLTIGGLDAARCFGKAFYGFNTQLAAFPSLEELNCLDMICLESWESEKEDSFPRLSVLIIKRCSKLSNLPRISSRSLRHLEIVDCPNLDSTKATKALKNLHFITSLKIERCDRLMSLPEGLRRLTSP